MEVEAINNLIAMFLTWPWWVQVLAILAVLFVLIVLINVLLIPFGIIVNRLTSNLEKSLATHPDDDLIGRVTVPIEGDQKGQVSLLIPGGTVNLRSAKLYREEERAANLRLEKGTLVVIVEEKDGVLYVIKADLQNKEA